MSQMQCQGLTLGYDHPLVTDLSFTVDAGDYLCVLGANGSGKSTLMKTLLGLQPPLGGTVTLGEGVHGGEIGYLPQQTQAQRDFPATVREIVRSGCQSRCGLRPFYSADEKALAEQSMARMGIVHLQKHSYRTLSGGQQQRVLLARALCAAQKMLLLDEPVTGLDPAASQELYQTILALNREYGMTILMISHDTQAALTYASHILYLGEPVFFGTRQAFLERGASAAHTAQEGGTPHGTV